MLVFLNHYFSDWKYEMCGGLGVQLFFVISGFLITRILINSQTGSLKHDLKTFYARRTIRIFPLYYMVVTVMFFAALLPANLLPLFYGYCYNIAKAFHHMEAGPAEPYWTLCVEEQFYLLCPLLVFKTPRQLLPKVLIGLLLISTIIGLLFDRFAPPDMTPRCLLIYSGQFLLWGCLAAYFDLTWGKDKKAEICLIAGCVALALWFLIYCSGLGLFLLFKGAAMTLIVFGLWNATNKWLLMPFRLPPIAYLGLISYGFYVYHDLAFIITVNLALRYPFLLHLNTFFLSLGVTVAMAALSWHLFEAPINKLKRHFPYGSQARRSI